MGIETDLNVNPYYDDFDENKDFHRVLFKPAVPLQARELTTLQSILQNQVEKFGQFTFKEGSIVKGCTFTYNRDIQYVKILDKDSSGLDINVNLYGEGDYLVSSTNLVSRVVSTAGGLETQNPDLNTIFFNYLNTADSGATTALKTQYQKGEELEVFPASTGIANIVFTGVPADLFVNNNDTISVTSDLNGTGFSGHVVTYDGNNQFLSVEVTANGSGFTADDLPTATIVAANGGVFTNGTSSANQTFDLATAISNGSITVDVNLIKSGNVTIANSEFETDASNTQFNVLGKAFQMKVQDGVIFQKGTFQRFSEQDIIVSKYTSKPNELTVGVTTDESFVNSSVDTSLLDNASGFANENAPGADRLKLVPTLVVNTISNAVTSNNFLRLVEFQHGMPVKLNSQAALSGLGEVLERRLYETSGDYVVQPLSLGTEQILSNTTHFTVAIGAGVGYNKGKRFELVNTSRLNVPKATTTKSVSNQELSINYGNYVEVKELVGEFGIEQNDRVLIMGTALQSITNCNDSLNLSQANTTGVNFTNANTTLEIGSVDSNVVGHARVRALEAITSDPNLKTSKYNLYLYDIQMNTGKSFEKHARAIFHYGGTEYSGTLSQTNIGTAATDQQTGRGIADLVLRNGKARVLDSGPRDRDLLFPLGQKGLKEISSSASYVYEGTASGQFLATGVATLQKSGTENWNFGTSVTTLTEAQENKLIIVPKQTVVANATIGTGTVTASNTITSVTNIDNYEEGDYIRVANSTANGGIFQIVQKKAAKLVLDRDTPNQGTSTNINIAYPEGKVISLKNRATAKADISSSGQTLTITLGRALNSTLDFSLLHNVKETSSPGIVKAYKTSHVLIHTNNNAATTSGPWCLGLPDVHKRVSVHKASSAIAQGSNAVANSIANGTMTDVTKEFEIDNGQTGNKYGLASLKLKTGSTLSIGSNDTIAVKVRHFTIASGTGFASIDSYKPLIAADETPTATTIATAGIPRFISNLSGREYSLRDVIDFRPYVTATATVEGTFEDADASVNPSNTEAITGTQYVSTPNESWIGDIQFYLPRKDRLVLEDGNLHVVRGTPDIAPELPIKPVNAMQLGTLDIPVYPSLDTVTAAGFGRPDLGVRIKMTQLKRYTMSDIKNIDQRVNNLEYYTSLNFLEKQTADQVIPSRTNATIDRFKNGFIVDNFASPTTGNPLNSEFKAGFDVARKLLTPRFEQYNIGLKFNAGNRLVQYGDVFTTEHTLRKIIEQPNATQSRRCTSAYWQYNGDIQLYPDYLNNVDVTHSPEQQIEIDIDLAHGTIALLDQLNKIMPIQSTEQEIIDEESTTSLISSVEDPTGTTRTDTYETVTTQKIKETTTGVKVDSKNTTKKVGEFVTNIAFQPYIPGVDIRFVALGLRPNLRHYPFFDDVKVSTDCAPAIIVNNVDATRDEFQLLSTNRAKGMIKRNGAFGTALTANSSGGLAGIFRVPARVFFAGERKFALADVDKLSQIKESVSAASAKFNCFNFAIEKGDVVQNTREPILSDAISSQIFSSTTTEIFEEVVTLPDDGGGPGANTDPDPDPDPPGDDTRLKPCADTEPPDERLWGPGDLNGENDEDGGRGQRRQPGRLRPCVECPEAYLEQLDSRGINARTRHNLRPGLSEREFACARFVDPLAQSFLLQEEMFDGAPMGYLRAVDLYFAGKNPQLGAFIEIREVKNGLPTDKILPFGKRAIKAANINVSTDGSVATRVHFKAPVAVETNKEYAFVVKPMANNPETKLFTAKAGQKSLVSGEAINQDWGAGSMFLSSNDRTWTPYLDEDAKFKLYAAYFGTTDATCELVNDDYEFLKVGTIAKGGSTTENSTDSTGNFVPGEEVFQLMDTPTVANVTFSTGNNIVAAGQDINLAAHSITAGSKIVLKNANTRFDVVEVDSVNSTALVLRGSPGISETVATSGSIMFTPTGTFEQLDANTNTILVNDSSAESGRLYTSGNTLVGCDSGAQANIASIEDTNITYHEPRLYNNVPNRTSVTTKVKGLLADNTMSSYTRIKTNDRNFPALPIRVASKSNEIASHSGNKSLRVKHFFSSDNRYVAPFVDTQSQSLLVYENILNNSTTNEYITGAGSADAKYISRQITLGNDLDAEDLKVFVNAYKPAGTDVKVYAKAVNQVDEVGFDKGTWSELQVTENGDKVSSSENRSDVIEYTFEFKDAPASTVQTGTVTFTNATTTVTGSGTNFDGDFAVGDLVKINNPPFDANTNYQISMVESIASDTSMTLADTIAIGDESDGRQIFKVDAADKNTIFRDPQSGVESDDVPAFVSTYYNANNEKLRGYKYLAIKIIMTGTSTSLAPYIQDYRALAVSI